MATLKDIMNDLQYGEGFSKFEKAKKNVLENYDSEGDIFYCNQYIKDIDKYSTITEDAEKFIDRICCKEEAITKRLYDGKDMTMPYKKMQATSILEDCKSIITKYVDSRKEYEEIKSKEELGKMIGAAKFFVENYLDGDAVFTESTNALFNKYVSDSEKEISSVLNG